MALEARQLLTTFAAAAVESLGQELAEAVVDRLSRAFQSEPAGGPATISAIAINKYLQGSVFGVLGAAQVEGWAAYQLEHMDPARARLLLQAAAASSDGTVDGTMRRLVAHLARR
jgi:hypothetical protein